MSNMLGTKEEYELRLSEVIVPCLSQFIVACRKSANGKSFNRCVAMQGRHKNSMVRFLIRINSESV